MGIRGTVRRAQDGHIIHRRAPSPAVWEYSPYPCCCEGLFLNHAQGRAAPHMPQPDAQACAVVW